jgi:hypothetical protein
MSCSLHRREVSSGSSASIYLTRCVSWSSIADVARLATSLFLAAIECTCHSRVRRSKMRQVINQVGKRTGRLGDISDKGMSLLNLGSVFSEWQASGRPAARREFLCFSVQMWLRSLAQGYRQQVVRSWPAKGLATSNG